ncbi:lipoyl(octanoyl) transferase LipB [Niveibacterium sp.]|uniref:lipoyl(octanoyl) transferase LipB n=1 Tax=Niveibacterium sp. TaxID=2017444 RepID=UPI0035B1C681
MNALPPPLLRKPLGRVEYEPTWRAMQAFTRARTGDTPDELWLVVHPPVFTLGLAGKPEHLLRETGIPLVKIDRGGQITYHGPGQAVVYLLIDLARREIKVRELVSLIEQAILDVLRGYGIDAHLKDGAPGVYVGGAKIAALGLKIANGCSYHGLSLNCDMDLSPFSAINPCGYPGLESAQLKDFGVVDPLDVVHCKLADALDARFAHHHAARRAA